MPDEDLPRWQQKLKKDIGENPARFLDRRLVEYGQDHTDHTFARMVRDRIKGIDRLAVVNAWIAVERKLDRGPRDRVIDLLEQRREFLQEHGERPDDLRTEWPQDLPERYNPANRDREVPPKECYVITADDERVPYDERPTRPQVGRTFDSTTDAEVATDGGESA